MPVCFSCKKTVDHLISVSDVPDHHDGNYCEACVDRLFERGAKPWRDVVIRCSCGAEHRITQQDAQETMFLYDLVVYACDFVKAHRACVLGPWVLRPEEVI